MQNKDYNFHFKDENVLGNVRLVVIGSIMLGIIAVIYYSVYLSHYGISDQPEYWGIFGEYIGGVLGAIFSFASTLLLVITLIYQRQQLFDGKSKAFDDQFFLLYKLFMNTKNDLRVNVGTIDKPMYVEGVECFRYYYDKYDFDTFGKTYEKAKREDIAYNWESIGAYGLIGLYGYFNSLLIVLRQFKGFDLYLDISRAQLSDLEMASIFLAGLTDEFKELKFMIESCALFSGVTEVFLVKVNDMIKFYNISAYGVLVEKYPIYFTEIDKEKTLAESFA